MKRMTAILFAALVGFTLVGCSNRTTDIEGTIAGYVQVEEYTKPLIVIESNGEVIYLALVGGVTAMDVDHLDETLLDGILNGEITDIKVHVEAVEKGKTFEIDGKNVAVWQSHQIQKVE